MMRRLTLNGILIAALVGALALAMPTGAEAKGKNKRKGKSSHVLKIVVNPAGLATQDAELDVSQSEVDGVPGPVQVSSAATGTGHWIHLPLDLPAGSNNGRGSSHTLFVMGVEICHQETSDTPPSTSFIDTIRFTKLESPLGSEIEHEDETDFMSETPVCLQSIVPFPFPVEGAVTLSLNLDFEKLDDVFNFGTIRILLAGQPEREISGPSTPSDPSDPSPPSGPSEPSEPGSSNPGPG